MALEVETEVEVAKYTKTTLDVETQSVAKIIDLTIRMILAS